MRGLVAQGGYRADSAIPAAVDGYEAGDVFYLAQASGSVDDPTLTAALASAGAQVRFRYPSIRWVALVSTIDAVGRVAALSQVTRLEVDRLLEVETLTASTQTCTPPAQCKRGTADVGADQLWA